MLCLLRSPFTSASSYRCFNHSVPASSTLKRLNIRLFTSNTNTTDDSAKPRTRTLAELGHWSLAEADPEACKALLHKFRPRREPLPYCSSGVKEVLASTPEECAELIDVIMKKHERE